MKRIVRWIWYGFVGLIIISLCGFLLIGWPILDDDLPWWAGFALLSLGVAMIAVTVAIPKAAGRIYRWAWDK